MVADGASVEATGAIVTGSAGWAYAALHQGTMRLGNPSAGASGNALGTFSVEPAGTNPKNGVPYLASGMVIFE